MIALYNFNKQSAENPKLNRGNRILRFRTNTLAAGSGSIPETVQFSGLLGQHRCKFSSATAGHAAPFDMVRELHHDMSSRHPKTNSELKFVVLITEQSVGFSGPDED
jgi:hypothetical protein